MSKVKMLPSRNKVKEPDTWDLSSLYADDGAWEKDFEKFQKQAAGYDRYRGKLAESSKTLAECLRFDYRLDRLGERLGTYAFLKTTEDQAAGGTLSTRGYPRRGNEQLPASGNSGDPRR